MKTISVVDCATENIANNCYNRLVDYFKIPIKFHCPSLFGMNSLSNDDSSAYIIFGSYSNVEERLDWQRDLAIFVNKKLLENTPVLGICFGHQLMADFYGADVIVNPSKIPLVGTRNITLTNGGFLTLFVSHSYQVTNLPISLERLGTSRDCVNEIIKHRSLPFTGIQAHPEASSSFLSTTLQGVEISKDKKDTAFNDGLSFIREFFTEYKLL